MSFAISVIVPVYNVVNTLDRCMDSILNQTFSDFEVILVDDGSTDGSSALCDKYCEQYNNVSVIHKNNEGLGPTRNAGILAATGDYIYHCDSDDWIKPDLLEKTYAAAISHNAEVVIFGYDIFTENNNTLKAYDTICVEDNCFESSQNIKKFFIEQYFNAFVVLSACNRIYKRSFLLENNIFFPDLRRCQDMAYSLLLFDKLSRLVTLKNSFYCYIIEPGVYKGRSYDEMLEIYYTIYSNTSERFKTWNLWNLDTEIALSNYICESVANYSSYAYIVKFPKEAKRNCSVLLADKRFQKIFKQYKNSKKSKFMYLFSVAMKLKSKSLLLFTSKLSQKIQGNIPE